MFMNNPFAGVTEFLSPLTLQIYIVLMILAVIVGTLRDVVHKGSARFFARRREQSDARATKRLESGESFSLALETIAEAAVSGEFCKWPRRLSHLLTMYGFVIYLITTIVLVFGYPGAPRVPSILPALWTIGASMVLIGGLWFFLFLRVNVAYDGESPFHVGRADLFVGSLILSVAFALSWDYVQMTYAKPMSTWIFFGLYIFFTTVLFGTVRWSKFAHMFFKPAVAYQRRIEEANGSTDLPAPSAEQHIVRS